MQLTFSATLGVLFQKTLGKRKVFSGNAHSPQNVLRTGCKSRGTPIVSQSDRRITLGEQGVTTNLTNVEGRHRSGKGCDDKFSI